MTSFSESDTLQKPHRTHPTRKSGETMLATLGTNATSKFFPHLDIARTKLLWLRRLVMFPNRLKRLHNANKQTTQQQAKPQR